MTAKSSSHTNAAATPATRQTNIFLECFFSRSFESVVNTPIILPNLGTEPVSFDLIMNQINIGNIIVHNVGIVNGKEILTGFIENPMSNDFIFALSQTKGMRILEKKKFSVGFNEAAFHHQNIFRNNNDIIAAGELAISSGKLLFTNFSGHFRPPYESLYHVRKYLIDIIAIKKNKLKIVNYRDLI